MDTETSARDDHPGGVDDGAGDPGARSRERRRRGDGRQYPLRVLVACAVVSSLVASLVVGVVSPALVGAGGGPSFSDVPQDHTFFEDIEWMARTKVSGGYLDGTFRPGANVTRQEMAAFMRRLYDLQEDRATVYSLGQRTTSSTAFTDIPNAATVITVPDGASASITARFAAESTVAGTVGSWGSVRLLIQRQGGNFQEMQPAVGADAVFDTTTGVVAESDAHAIERYWVASPGIYVVKAQFRASSNATSFTVDDYTLVVETDLEPSTFSIAGDGAMMGG